MECGCLEFTSAESGDAKASLAEGLRRPGVAGGRRKAKVLVGRAESGPGTPGVHKAAEGRGREPGLGR